MCPVGVGAGGGGGVGDLAGVDVGLGDGVGLVGGAGLRAPGARPGAGGVGQVDRAEGGVGRPQTVVRLSLPVLVTR